MKRKSARGIERGVNQNALRCKIIWGEVLKGRGVEPKGGKNL